jgi:hypothetical protein
LGQQAGCGDEERCGLCTEDAATECHGGLKEYHVSKDVSAECGVRTGLLI